MFTTKYASTKMVFHSFTEAVSPKCLAKSQNIKLHFHLHQTLHSDRTKDNLRSKDINVEILNETFYLSLQKC